MIGEEVRRQREELGLTGAQLAERAGLAPSAVSQIETGRRVPSSASVVKLAEGLGVDVGDLYPKKAQAALPLEVPLMDHPQVRDWLREQGHMTDEEFLDYAAKLDLRIDEDGFPTGLEHAIAELRRTCNALEAGLNDGNVQEALFPRQKGLSGKEAIKELFKQRSAAWKLKVKLRHEYLTRELALMNYGRWLHYKGETSDHLMYARHADRERRRWLEATYAEARTA